MYHPPVPFEFIPQSVPDVLLVRPRAFGDDRGFFMETWRRSAFAKAGLPIDFVQDNVARSLRKGVLRGLHFQKGPHAQSKLVRCSVGRIFDVAVDIRGGSPTYGSYVAAELSEDDRAMLFVPKGFAHGYVTLTDVTEVTYKVDAEYAPAAEGGLLWNDPTVGVPWPVREPALNERDRKWPGLSGLGPA